MYARGHNQQDTFGLTLAAQLREVCDPSFRLTSGANRQIRQLGTPLTQFVNPRSEGRVIVATRGAEVRTPSIHSQYYLISLADFLNIIASSQFKRKAFLSILSRYSPSNR